MDKVTIDKDIDKDKLNGYSIGINLFNWIINNIPLSSTILELGSGAGSHELSKYFSVYSIEQNRDYVNLYPDVNYIYAPISKATGWYEESCISLLPKDYQLLILDGPAGFKRSNFIQYSKHFNLNVPIIIDDVHRAPESNFAMYMSSQYNKRTIYMPEEDKASVILW